MSVATKERKAKAEKIEKTVQFLNRYFFKATGSIVWHVRNGENKEYCVTLNTNGTTGCYNKATKKECPGHKYAYSTGHDCHHVIDCQLQEERRAEQMAAIRAQDVAEIEAAWVAVGGSDLEIDLGPNEDGNYRNLLTYCMALEEERASEPVDTTDLIIDAEYDAWKRENDLDMPLTEEQINDIARYELAVL